MQRRMEAEWYILIYAKESEVINMKKAKRNVAVNGLMMFALFFSTVAANTYCMCIFHQPRKPKELERLRKF